MVGTCLRTSITESLRSRKERGSVSSHYASAARRGTAGYLGEKGQSRLYRRGQGACLTGGGLGVLEAIGGRTRPTPAATAHGCPDKGADSMFTYAKSKGAEWGRHRHAPEVVGLALYKDGHVGYYVGNGEAVERKSFAGRLRQ